jgi:DNA repair protein RecO (recombination protein O)
MKRLFALPAFLHRETDAAPSRDEIRAGFALTEFFLRTHLFEARGLPVPEERSRFVALSTRNEASPGG